MYVRMIQVAMVIALLICRTKEVDARCAKPPNIDAKKWVYVRVSDPAAAANGNLIYSNREADLYLSGEPPPLALRAGDDCFYIDDPASSQLFVALANPLYSRTVKVVPQVKVRSVSTPFVYSALRLNALAAAEPVHVTVEPGDTPRQFAKRWGIPDGLFFVDREAFQAGKRIKVPLARSYRVEPGDTLWGLSQTFASENHLIDLQPTDQLKGDGNHHQRTGRSLVTGERIDFPASRPALRGDQVEALIDRIRGLPSGRVRRISTSELVVFDVDGERERPAVAIFESEGAWYLFGVSGVVQGGARLVTGPLLGSGPSGATINATACDAGCPQPFAEALLGDSEPGVHLRAESSRGKMGGTPGREPDRAPAAAAAGPEKAAAKKPAAEKAAGKGH